MTWHTRGLTIADPEQVVLESEPYRRLSYTWHTFTPEWAESLDFTDDARDRLTAEGRSKVTFEIEALGDQVKLTVIHDDLEPGGLTGSLISQGWPRVLANLKTLLETGDTLPDLRPTHPGPARPDAMTGMDMAPALRHVGDDDGGDDVAERGARDRASCPGRDGGGRGAAVRRRLPRQLGAGRRRRVRCCTGRPAR